MSQVLYLIGWNQLFAVLVGVAVWLLCRIETLRRRPAVCHALWLLVLLKLVTPPLIPLPVLPAKGVEESQRVAVLPSTSNVVEGEAKTAPALADARAVAVEANPSPSNSLPTIVADVPEPRSSARPVAGHRMDWQTLVIALAAVSLCGTGALWLAAVRQFARVRRLLRGNAVPSGRAADILREVVGLLPVRSSVGLLIVDASIPPMLWAELGRSAIVLPRQLTDSLDERQLQNILAHELAHFARRDHWVDLLAFTIATVFWWNPMAWFARRELAASAEACCDALAVERLRGSRKSYAETLLAVVDSLNSPALVRSTWGSAFGESYSLRRRFELIADTRVQSKLPRGGSALLVLALAGWTIMPARAQVDNASPPRASAGGDAEPAADAGAVAKADHAAKLPEGAIARLGSNRLRQPGGAGLLVWSPDGCMLASADNSKAFGVGTITLWNAQTGAAISTWMVHGNGIGSLDFSPDGKRLLAATWDRCFYLWDVATGGQVVRMSADDPSKYGTLMPSYARFFADGKWLVYGGRDGVLRVFATSSGKARLDDDLTRYANRNTSDVEYLAVAPDGKTMALAMRRGKLLLWNLAEDKPLRELSGNVGFSNLRFTRDGLQVAWLERADRKSGRKGGLYVMDVAAGDPRQMLRDDPFGNQESFDFSPDGSTVAVAYWTGGVQFFDLASGMQTGSIKSAGGAVAYSPDGRRLATSNGVIQLWDTQSGQELLGDDARHRNDVVAGVLVGNGNIALTGSKDGTVLRWNVKESTPERPVQVPTNWWEDIDVALSPDGRLAVFARGAKMHLIDLAGGKPLALAGFREKLNEIPLANSHTGLMHFSADGSTLATMTHTSTGAKPIVSVVRVWDTATGACRSEARIETPAFFVPDMALSADGKQFLVFRLRYEKGRDGYKAAEERDYAAQLYDAATGQMVREYREKRLFPNGLAFVPHGRQFVTGTGDTINFFDIASGEYVSTIRGNREGGMLDKIVFSPDSTRVAAHLLRAQSQPQTFIHVWDCATGKLTHEFAATPLALNFSPDGQRLIACLNDYTAMVYDLKGGAPPAETTKE